MKAIRPIIWFATIYLLIYAFTAFSQWIPEVIPIVLWFLSPLVVIYLVYNVLKHGEPSDKTWDDGYFYEDREQLTDPS